MSSRISTKAVHCEGLHTLSIRVVCACVCFARRSRPGVPCDDHVLRGPSHLPFFLSLHIVSF
jgi:hypothetical protein